MITIDKTKYFKDNYIPARIAWYASNVFDVDYKRPEHVHFVTELTKFITAVVWNELPQRIGSSLDVGIRIAIPRDSVDPYAYVLNRWTTIYPETGNVNHFSFTVSIKESRRIGCITFADPDSAMLSTVMVIKNIAKSLGINLTATSMPDKSGYVSIWCKWLGIDIAKLKNGYLDRMITTIERRFVITQDNVTNLLSKLNGR